MREPSSSSESKGSAERLLAHSLAANPDATLSDLTTVNLDVFVLVFVFVVLCCCCCGAISTFLKFY